ncbi:MAG TPA: right-handed parallel beta-helix repeat-containing protein, partial [Baekduia sp.]
MSTLRSLARAAFTAMLLLVLLGTASSAASAADRQVATTGTDDGDCVASPCASLDYAQQQVQAGDTVQLAAGVYSVGGGTFDVDDVTYERSGPGEAKITLPGDSNGIQVNGNDLTFRDLSVSSSDDTIQGDTYAFTYHGSGLTLDHMLVEHMSQGVEFGHGVTVTDSTFADIAGTAITLDDGLATATDNDFDGDGIHVTEQSTVMATGNVFRGHVAAHGGNGIYLDTGSAGGTITGNRFSPNLEFGINSGGPIDAPNNWWGCNEGVDHAGCVGNYDLSTEDAEPHLVLDVSGSPDPFLTTGDSTITAHLTSSDPESTFTGGPVGTAATLSTSEGTLDDPSPAFVAGVAQTTLRDSVAGLTEVTATLDNASASTFAAQSITFTSDAPTDAAVGGSYTATADGGGSTQPVTFTIDAESTPNACTISDATVSFIGVGTCTIDADQAGELGFVAAVQQQQSFEVARGAQTITFTSDAPTDAAVGGTYDLTATGGASGKPVTFSIDQASDTDTCMITDATVSFTGPGSCVIDADQADNDSYDAAGQQQQSFDIARGAQTITFTSSAPTTATVGGTYDLTATGGASDKPVTFSIDPASDTDACTITDSTVSFTGPGSCVIDADQLGDATYAAAAQEQQTVTVSPAPVTSASLSP